MPMSIYQYNLKMFVVILDDNDDGEGEDVLAFQYFIEALHHKNSVGGVLCNFGKLSIYSMSALTNAAHH